MSDRDIRLGGFNPRQLPVDWGNPMGVAGGKPALQKPVERKTDALPQGWKCPICAKVISPFVEEHTCG